MTEMGAYGYECAAQAGLHVNESEFIAEVLDPATGRPAREGELVLTNLGRAGSPLAALSHRRPRAAGDGPVRVRTHVRAARGRHPGPRRRHAGRPRGQRLSLGSRGHRSSLRRRGRVHDRGVSPGRDGRGETAPRGPVAATTFRGGAGERPRGSRDPGGGASAVPLGSLPRYELKAKRLVRRAAEP